MAASSPKGSPTDLSRLCDSSANRGPGVEVKSKVVNYRGLNIKTTEGVQTLLGRIRQASEEVCSAAPDSIGNIGDFSNYEGKTDAIDRALAQVKSPALSAVYGRVH